MVRKMVLWACCTTWRCVRSGIFPMMIRKKLSFQAKREGESGLNVLVIANYSEKMIRLALARMIIIDNYLLNLWSVKIFKNLWK